MDANELCADHEQFRVRLEHRLPDATQLEAVLKLNGEQKAILAALEDKKRRRNELSRQVATAKEPDVRDRPRKQARTFSEEIKQGQAAITQCEQALNEALLDLPNVPHPSIPRGADDASNREVRRWGEAGLPVAESARNSAWTSSGVPN